MKKMAFICSLLIGINIVFFFLKTRDVIPNKQSLTKVVGNKNQNQKIVFNEKEIREYQNNFFLYFKPLDTLSLNLDGLIVGQIRDLITLHLEGKIVLHEATGRRLIWVNIRKNEFKYLSVERLVPGHILRPERIVKNPIDGFWVLSTPGYFFRFDDDGELLRYYQMSDQPKIRKFIPENGKSILLHIISAKESYLARYDYHSNSIQKLFALHVPDGSHSFLFRFRMADGLLLNHDKTLYYANPIEPFIYNYELNGNLLRVLKIDKPDFQQVKENFPKDLSGMQAFFFENQNMSRIYKIHFLDQNILMAHCVIERSSDIEFFDLTSGKVLNRKRILPKGQLIYAENNILYCIEQPEEMDENFDVPNPYIIRYQLKPNAFKH